MCRKPKVLIGFLTAWLAVASPGEENRLLIGVSNVQSGPSQSLGKELLGGSLAYFNLVNGKGGIFGRKISVVLKDDRYEPEPAIQNTNDLITKDKVFFLFDYVGTPTLTRVLPLLTYYKALRIVSVAPFTGANPQRTPPYNEYVFNVRASYIEEAHALVNYLYAKGYRRIGFLGQADAYGMSGRVGVEEALRRHNLEVIADVTYPRNGSSAYTMHDQVSYLRSKQVDAVIAVGVYGPCSAFIRDARVSGWNIPIANVSFVDADAMLGLLRAESKTARLDLTQNLINSQVVPFLLDSHRPLVKSYLAEYRSKVPGFTSLEGWLNAVIVTEALKRAGPNPSRDAFVRAMESLYGWDPGIGYKLSFSPKEHQGLHRVWLTKTRNAEWVNETSLAETR